MEYQERSIVSDIKNIWLSHKHKGVLLTARDLQGGKPSDMGFLEIFDKFLHHYEERAAIGEISKSRFG